MNTPDNHTAGSRTVALPEIVIGEPTPLGMTPETAPEMIAALTLAAHRDIAQLLVFDINDEIRRRRRALVRRATEELAGNAEGMAAADRDYDRTMTRTMAYENTLSHLVHLALKGAGVGPEDTDGNTRNAAFTIIKLELGWLDTAQTTSR